MNPDRVGQDWLQNCDKKFRKSIAWMNDFKLTDFVSRPVSLKIELSADAKIYAIRFDELFWD